MTHSRQQGGSQPVGRYTHLLVAEDLNRSNELSVTEVIACFVMLGHAVYDHVDLTMRHCLESLENPPED